MAKIIQASFIVQILIIYLGLVINLSLSSSAESSSVVQNVTHFNRRSFPAGFLFGAASAAYQYEGAVSEGGRGPSIWDTYTHNFPDRIADGSNGDVADDFYHRYKDDVKLMKHIGLDVFRMSISWSRILPRGKLTGGINKEGIAFYNNVFNELLANGITPFVTLFHWDLPQALEDEYRGFLSPLVVDDFRNFAELCFREFGDRVEYWTTVNEPFIFISTGYDGQFAGSLAPGRCSYWANCTQGDSATEPYVAGHNLLLCHAATVKLYKEKYQATQKGKIGIVLVSHMFVPASNKTQDVQAAQRALDFLYGWFAHPIVYGDYPESMRTFVGDRLPEFTHDQRKMLTGSYDYLGLNYYTGNYASNITTREGNVSMTSDKMVHLSTQRLGRPIGAPTGVSIFFDYPRGLRDLLVYIKKNYKNPIIYITENGMGDIDNGTAYGVNDPQRIRFYNGHLRAVREAMKYGVRVRGYIAWSFLDTFEWGSGYTVRFGLVFVDFKDGLKRIPKRSALWFRNFLLKK